MFRDVSEISAFICHWHFGLQDFHKFGEALEPVVEKGGICVVGSADACGEAKAGREDMTRQLG